MSVLIWSGRRGETASRPCSAELCAFLRHTFCILTGSCVAFACAPTLPAVPLLQALITGRLTTRSSSASVGLAAHSVRGLAARHTYSLPPRSPFPTPPRRESRLWAKGRDGDAASSPVGAASFLIRLHGGGLAAAASITVCLLRLLEVPDP